MINGPNFPDSFGPKPDPHKPIEGENTPVEADLQEKIDEVKEALQQELKAEEKLLGSIYKKGADQMQAHPEMGAEIAKRGNKQVSDHVDNFFDQLPPGAKQQLQDIAGKKSDQVAGAIKDDLKAKYSLGSDDFSSDLMALVDAYNKASGTTEADAIFQEIELALDQGGAPSVNSSPTAAAPQESKQQRIEKAFQDFVNNQKFSGTVLVVQGGKTLFDQSAGMADGTTPNTDTTTYRWESVTKVITATAIMRLKEMNVLPDLNAQITDYLPEYGGSPGFSGITIKELLNYTSGIPQLPAQEPPIWKTHPPKTLKDILDFVSTEPRVVPNGGPPVPTNPGYQYSDTAYNLLAYLIDRVTATLPPDMNSFSKFVTTEIFHKAGMTTASMPDTPAEDTPEAQGHDINGNEIIPNDLLFRLGTGNAIGSALDLYKFDKALSTPGQILSSDDVNSMQNNMYGWFGNTDVVPGQKDYEKGGSMAGGEAFYYRIPGTDTTIIIMRNKDPIDHNNPDDRSEYLAEEIAQILAS